MKRKLIAISLAIITALSVAGCSNGSSSQDTSNSNSDDKTTVKLVVWSSGAAENFQKEPMHLTNDRIRLILK